MSSMNQKSQRSPKSPTLSCQERFGWVFGDPLEKLPQKKKPSESDIVRHWMFLYDKKSGSLSHYKVSMQAKNSIVSDVAKSLIEHWKIQGFGVEIRSELAIIKKLKKVYNRLHLIRVL